MKHRLVRALVAHFAERAGYTGPLRVYLNFDRFDRIRRRRAHSEQPDEHKDYGMALTGRSAVVWVNVSKHRTIAQLADTAAHEACHLVDLGHGPTFDRAVRRLLRGGRL